MSPMTPLKIIDAVREVCQGIEVQSRIHMLGDLYLDRGFRYFSQSIGLRPFMTPCFVTDGVKTFVTYTYGGAPMTWAECNWVLDPRSGNV